VIFILVESKPRDLENDRGYRVVVVVSWMGLRLNPHPPNTRRVRHPGTLSIVDSSCQLLLEPLVEVDAFFVFPGGAGHHVEVALKCLGICVGQDVGDFCGGGFLLG